MDKLLFVCQLQTGETLIEQFSPVLLIYYMQNRDFNILLCEISNAFVSLDMYITIFLAQAKLSIIYVSFAQIKLVLKQ